MAFSESTAVADRLAFMTAFINFAVANAGFTNQGTTVDGPDTIYHISKGSIYWNFLQTTNVQVVTNYNIDIRMSFAKILTVSAFNDVGTTAGQYIKTRFTTWGSTGPYTKYFLYTDGNAVHCVLGVYTGVYSHLSFGNMVKFGTWMGGEYVTATGMNYYSGTLGYSLWDYERNCILFDGGVNNQHSGSNYPVGFVRHIVGSASNDRYDFARIGDLKQSLQQCKMVTGSTDGLITPLIELSSPISFNQRAPVIPVYVRFLEEPTDRWVLGGYIPYVRMINVEHLAGETLVENDWIVFPLAQKEGGDAFLASTTDYWGVAYKRVA